MKGVGEGCSQNGQTYVGKWLIFVPPEYVDEIWDRVKKATETGKLGISAKVSTAWPSAYESQDHVICVYTYDFRDKADVGRVLGGLRDLEIPGRLFYKTDQATLSGVYSTKGKKKKRASLYSSDDFDGDARERTKRAEKQAEIDIELQRLWENLDEYPQCLVVQEVWMRACGWVQWVMESQEEEEFLANLTFWDLLSLLDCISPRESFGYGRERAWLLERLRYYSTSEWYKSV